MQAKTIQDQIIFLYCSDLGVTAYFYEELLGFPLVVDQGSCRIVKMTEEGGGYLGYCERLKGEKAPGGMILTMVVSTNEEVDSWYSLLRDRGVDVDEPPAQNQEYKVYHFFFKDPDGYKLEIQSFNDPQWNEPF